MLDPATVRGKRTRRLLEERTKGVLWIHASVNLVEPRTIASAAAVSPARAGDRISVSIPESAPQPLKAGLRAEMELLMVALSEVRAAVG